MGIRKQCIYVHVAPRIVSIAEQRYVFLKPHFKTTSTRVDKADTAN